MSQLDKPAAKALNCTQGRITFNKVKFHYKGMQALLKIGLVGYSGAGKSTFVNLILRLYDVTDGAILIDGQDIRDVKQDSLRENIAIIPQDPSLFHRNLMENIRYGRADSTIKAHAHEFIIKLPQSYELLVGERVVKLSGRQPQRIAIARAILKNAPILILDEATNQLGFITKSLIQNSLWELIHNHTASFDMGKTTIIITHRLSTLLHMEQILVFDKGKINENGAHSQLLAQAGLYKHLQDAQVGGFLGDEKQKNKV